MDFRVRLPTDIESCVDGIGSTSMTPKHGFREIYRRAAGAVAFIAVSDTKGDEHIGSAFHIGEGVFVTARHVVEGSTIKEIATTRSAPIPDGVRTAPLPPRRLRLTDGPHFGPDDLDVAVFRVDLEDRSLPAITASSHTDYDLGENDLILADVLVIGYPPIPFTTIPFQVATLGQVNAVVHVRHSPALHFIASATARGGFSGGPVIDQEGKAVAVVTESLGQSEAPVETGYMSLLSIASAVDLAAEKFGFSLYPGHTGRYSDTLFAARFSSSLVSPLNSLIYDANIYVYDDDHDVLVEIECVDAILRDAAVKAFGAITPLARHDVDGVGVVYVPIGNPTAQRLLKSAHAVVALFRQAGYRKVSSKRSQWQLTK